MPKDADASGENLRPRRSRKDRPCDHCRRAKRSCHIIVRGEACTHCRKANRECSFNAPPLNRHRKASPSSGTPSGPLKDRRPSVGSATTTSPSVPTVPDGPIPFAAPLLGDTALVAATEVTQPGLSPQTSLPSPYRALPALANISPAYPPPLPSTSTWIGERSTLAAPARGSPRSSVSAFIDSLEEDQSRLQRSSSNDDSNYDSLDMEVTEEEESHYLGSGAVAQLATVSLDSRIEARNTDLPYRQVADPRYPAYFLKNPSKVYGISNAAFVAEKAYQDVLAIISGVDPSMPERLIKHFLKRTLPALPILNQVRFEASLHGWHGAGRFPYAVLVGIFAHAAVYEPLLRRHCKALWSILLHVCDNEYRQPRLQILQLEILNITGRPILNPGGNHLGICRAVGAIQLLGLHRDCSRWKLPKWERSLRKRLWWTLYIDDKWNAYTYGRPVNLDSARSTIPPLTVDDDDWNKQSHPERATDISCFIALSRLSTILENLLPLLLDRDGGSRKYGLERSVLVHAANELDTLYRDLPSDLVFNPETNGPARPGCRSLQLAHIGITTLICRLGLERDDFLTLEHMVSATKKALGVIEGLAVFLESLKDEDYNSFWTPWSAYQLSNAVTLLLQQAIRVSQHPAREEAGRSIILADVFALLRRLVAAIQLACQAGFEVAEAASPRIKSLIKAMPPIPGIETVQAILAPATTVAPLPEWVAAVEAEPGSDILALFDWLNGDRVF